jgi:excisionase family DNA binding protein
MSLQASKSTAATPGAAPLYLTVAQVAEMLQVDETTITRWALEDASMPVFKRGRIVRFPRAALLVWLGRHERRGSSRTDPSAHAMVGQTGGP